MRFPSSLDASAVPVFGPSVDGATVIAHVKAAPAMIPSASPPPPPLPLQATRDDEAWPRTALLWWCMRHPRWSFMHVPKTGGTAVELVDKATPSARLATFFQLRHANGSAMLDIGRGGCRWWPQRKAHPNVVHMTPAQWSACFGELLNPYKPFLRYGQSGGGVRIATQVDTPSALALLDSGGVYCVVRDPIDRFVSEFLDARFHWYWPMLQCPIKSVWDVRKPQLALELWCFARLTLRLVQSLRAQWRALRAATQGASTKATEGRASGHPVGSVVAAAIRHDAVNFSELLTHLQPQYEFVIGEYAEGTRPSCDIVFSFDDALRAGLPPDVNRINYLRGPKFRSQIRQYSASNASLYGMLVAAYPTDFDLWERVRRHERPTALHGSSVDTLASALLAARPRTSRREPDCSPGPDCTCAACCAPSYRLARESRHACLSCHFGHAKECGGLDLDAPRPWRVPRSIAGARCGEPTSPWCNTCAKCCKAPWVMPSGESCEHCAAIECAISNSTL